MVSIIDAQVIEFFQFKILMNFQSPKYRWVLIDATHISHIALLKRWKLLENTQKIDATSFPKLDATLGLIFSLVCHWMC